MTQGCQGDMVSNMVSLNQSYYDAGLCPVNVHWHADVEHFLGGEYNCSDPTHCGPYNNHNEENNNDEHRTLDGSACCPI